MASLREAESVVLAKLREAFDADGRGGVSKVARSLDLDSRMVGNWFVNGYVPATWALHVERKTDGKVSAMDVLREYEAKAPKRGFWVRAE